MKQKSYLGPAIVAYLAIGAAGAAALRSIFLPDWARITFPILGVYLIFGWILLFRSRQVARRRQTSSKIRDEALEALGYKASLERILNDVFIALLEANSLHGFEVAVNNGLSRIGAIACVDRAYIFFLAEDQATLMYAHEWCAPTILSQKEKFRGVDIASVPWLIATLHNNDHVLISKDTGFPAHASAEQRIFGHPNNQAMILVPIRARKTLLGFIGFDFVAQPWIDEDIDLLRTLSNILGSAITRIRTDAKLVEREQSLIVYRDQLKLLMKELTLAEERERRKVAKDLHDQIGQMLAVVKIKQKKLAQTLSDADTISLSTEIVEMVDQVLKDVRSLTFELSGLAVFRDDLNAAIDGLGKRALTEHGISFSFRVEGDQFEVPEHVRTILYQIVRELFYNTIKHATARHVETVMSWSPTALQIRVVDDGRGFLVSETRDLAQKDHFGLFNIRERVDSLGGKFIITSPDGQGTRAEVCIPLPGPTTEVSVVSA